MRITLEQFKKLASAEILQRETQLMKDARELYIPTSNGFFNMYDVVDSVLYDRVTLIGNTPIDSHCTQCGSKVQLHQPTKLNLFTTSVGQVCPLTNKRKTYVDTNMYGGYGMLEAPTSFIIRRIGFLTPQVDLLTEICKAASWILWLGQKWFAKGPLIFDTHLGAIQRRVKATGDYWPLGDNVVIDPSIEEFRTCSSLGGLHLLSQMSFNLEIQWPDGVPSLDTPVDFWGCLVGLEYRGIS